VDCTLAPEAATGRLDYETLEAMDKAWAMDGGAVGSMPYAFEMDAAALFSVANTPGAIMTGPARALITPGHGPSWYIVKGAGNPTNTPTGINQDYVNGSMIPPNYRQAIQ